MNPQLLWLIPTLPFAGFLLSGTLGRRLPRALVATIALLFTLAPALIVADLWIYMKSAGAPLALSVVSQPWIAVSGFTVNFAFTVDHLTLIMLGVITGVGFLIHIYSVGYMAHEEGYWRFFAYLNLFMFFMLVLVLASSFLLLFVGWEGVGLASYLLIGFYFTKDSAANAGKKAFIVNRIGDFGFLLAMFLLVAHYGTLDFGTIFTQIAASPLTGGIFTLIALLLVLGATGKSAQIPLYIWLPDAMAGPTPVSALIHAATMVTAGIYMVARCHVLFDHSPVALTTVACIGAATALFAATIGLVQHDIKRVLAYSTVSQLGYMFLACGVGAYSAGIFHLMTHAFFKALLFLGAGSVIHGIGGEQDMRKMGGLRKYMPWTFWTMLIATLAISGIPPFAGFFSKDEILWQAFSSPHGSKIFWFFGVITAFMTSFYMFRLIFLTFTGEYRGAKPEAGSSHGSHDDQGHHAPHESPWLMLAPLVLLGVLSIIGGWVGIGNRFEHFLDPVIQKVSVEQSVAQNGEAVTKPVSDGEGAAEESKGLENILMGVSVLVAFSGLGLAWFLYVKRPELPSRIAEASGGLYTLVLNKYWIDELYSAAIIGPLVALSRVVLWQTIDQKVIDGTVNESAVAARDVSQIIRQQQSGLIRSYAGWIAAGAAAVVAYMVWMGTR
jgi:NADH-quinone oxidoreductase subunit L